MYSYILVNGSSRVPSGDPRMAATDYLPVWSRKKSLLQIGLGAAMRYRP